jgi:hypothetical protein
VFLHIRERFRISHSQPIVPPIVAVDYIIGNSKLIANDLAGLFTIIYLFIRGGITASTHEQFPGRLL